MSQAWRALCLAVCLLIAPTAHGTDVFQWIKKEVIDKITVTGRRTLGFHKHQVEGDREAFELLNYYGEGGKTFTDFGYMTFTGDRVMGAIKFRSTVDTNRFKDPQSQDFVLDYTRKPLSVTVGDVYGSLLNTNRLAPFSKLLKGTVAEYSSGPIQVKGIYSQARGSARTITLQGNNSAGPYYLSFGQIVRGSETVLVDGDPMVLGQDYVISYEVGTITFVGRVIAPTSTITISFEALADRSGGGTIQGVSATYNFGRAGRLGIVAMEQKTGASNVLSNRLELFQGAGAASTPYFLQFEPLTTFPIVVKLDGILQTEGIDYYFDTQNPTVFFFTRFISFDSTISVSYTPKPTQTLDGDRSVVGFDYRLQLATGKNAAYVGYSQATGELKSPVNPLKGTARSIEAGWNLGNWQLNGEIKDIPDGFVSVESRGFNRNERSVGLNARYRGGGPWQLEMRNTNSSVSIRSTDANGNYQFRPAHLANFSATAAYNAKPGEPWNLEYRRTRSLNSGNESRSDSIDLSTARTFGRLITDFGFQKEAAKGPVAGNLTGGKDIELNTLHASASYTAGPAWAFRANTSVSQIRTGGESGVGSDIALHAGYEPSDRFGVNVDYSISDSGRLATLGGFDNGLGLGYNGNGYSGGFTGTPFSLGATDVRRFHVGSFYRPSNRLSLRADYTTLRGTGSVTSNAQSGILSTGAEIDLGNGTFLDFDMSKSDTKFVGSGNDSSALSFDARLRGNPKGRLSYRIGVNFLQTGGSSQFQQNGAHVDAGVAYRLAPRQSLAFDFYGGTTNGYAGQRELIAGVSYQYQIWKSLALIGSYRIRDIRNLDSSSTSGAYRSRGFDLELTFTFGGW